MFKGVLSLFKSNRSEQEPSYYELEDAFDEELYEEFYEDESESEIDPGITSWHNIP